MQLSSLDRPGFVYGAFQSYARAFYAELLPPGEEARWQVFYNIHKAQILIRRNRYGLFSITDKVSLGLPVLPYWPRYHLPCNQSSSFLGPLIVGLIADGTGNIRYAFFFLVFMIWLAVPILMNVNVERGRSDARAYRYQAVGEM
jgi:UMF1 family MFS transporter